MNVGMMTTYKVKCGIASYSQNLASALAKHDTNVYILRIPRYGMKDQGVFQNVVDRIPVDKIDVLHVQSEYGLYGKLNSPLFNGLHKLGKPIVTTMHATGADDDMVIGECSDKIIVHNEWCKNRFAGDQSKTVIIPHGMTPLQTPLPPKELCKKRLNIQPDVPVVGYVGFISQYKGLEWLIQAMVDVPNAGLLIGGGWFVEQDTNYIVSLKQKGVELLPHRCQWIGFVPDRDLAVTYGAMDIVVYPSRFMSESGAMLMAVSHGKAVIATDLAPIREKAAKGALMTFKTTTDLSEKIKLLLSDEKLRETLEENAANFTRENSWSNIAQQHISLYETLHV